MAGEIEHGPTPDSSHLSTQQLRDLAQSHLLEIQDEKSEEARHLEKIQSDIQKYAKPTRQKGKAAASKTQSSSSLLTTAPAIKGPKLRSAQDVLDRLRWDPSVKLSEYVVGYLERFEGLKEMPVSQWVKETTDEEFIPQHRIRYVKKVKIDGDGDAEEEIIWDRDARIDKLFGSGGGGGGDSGACEENRNEPI